MSRYNLIASLVIVFLFSITFVSGLSANIQNFPGSVSLTAGTHRYVPFSVYIDGFPHFLTFFMNVTNNNSNLDGLEMYISPYTFESGHNDFVLEIITSPYYAPDNFTFNLFAEVQDEVPYVYPSVSSGSSGGSFPIPFKNDSKSDIVQTFINGCSVFSNSSNGDFLYKICPNVSNSDTCIVNGRIIPCNTSTTGEVIPQNEKKSIPIIFWVIGIMVLIIAIVYIIEIMTKKSDSNNYNGGLKNE